MEAKRLFNKPKSLTLRKFFGQYFHALISHAPQQFRIMSLSSPNAENEERSFNFLKKVSTLTSNHHPENVMTNAFIRIEKSSTILRGWLYETIYCFRLAVCKHVQNLSYNLPLKIY